MTEAAIAGAATKDATIREIADEAFTAFNSGGRHVLPFSTRYPAFSLNDAYRVTALVNNMRVAQGYKPVVTPQGQAHPVTRDLPGANSGSAPPSWGRWFRLIGANKIGGETVMSGPGDRPLLVLDNVGKGRVAELRGRRPGSGIAAPPRALADEGAGTRGRAPLRLDSKRRNHYRTPHDGG